MTPFTHRTQPCVRQYPPLDFPATCSTPVCTWASVSRRGKPNWVRARFLMEVWMLQFPSWCSRRNAPGTPKCSHHSPRSTSALVAPERGWLPGFLAAKLPSPSSHVYVHLLWRLLFKAALHASVWEVEKEKARRYTQVIYPKSQDLRPDVRGGLSYRFRTFTGKPKTARDFALLLKFLLAYTWLLL